MNADDINEDLLDVNELDSLYNKIFLILEREPKQFIKNT